MESRWRGHWRVLSCQFGKHICSPKHLGGLGVKNLILFSRALRIRWPWLSCKNPVRPWNGSALPCNSTVWALFSASTVMSVGIGEMAKFWSGRRLNNQAPKALAPNLLLSLEERTLQLLKAWMRADGWTAFNDYPMPMTSIASSCYGGKFRTL